MFLYDLINLNDVGDKKNILKKFFKYFVVCLAHDVFFLYNKKYHAIQDDF